MEHSKHYILSYYYEKPVGLAGRCRISGLMCNNRFEPVGNRAQGLLTLTTEGGENHEKVFSAENGPL